MINLLGAIWKIESEIKRLENEKNREIEKINDRYTRKIKQLEIALEVNKELNEVCFKCEGTGQYRFTDAAGDIDEIVCPDCNGTGRKNKSAET